MEAGHMYSPRSERLYARDYPQTPLLATSIAAEATWPESTASGFMQVTLMLDQADIAFGGW